MHYAHQIDVQRTAQLAYAVASEFVGLGADLQNILRFIVRLSWVYRKIDLRYWLKKCKNFF